jgi:hypothetical protein
MQDHYKTKYAEANESCSPWFSPIQDIVDVDFILSETTNQPRRKFDHHSNSLADATRCVINDTKYCVTYSEHNGVAAVQQPNRMRYNEKIYHHQHGIIRVHEKIHCVETHGTSCHNNRLSYEVSYSCVYQPS